MARVGISKTYLAGTLTDVTALFGILKTFIVDAGFYVVTNTATHIEFMPAGTTPAANTDDDTPHFHLYQTGTTQIYATALYGLAWDDANIRASSPALVVQTPIQYYDGGWLNADITFHAAADGRDGWFWIASMQTQWDPDNEIDEPGYHKVIIGTRSARLSADMTSGLAARYGIFDVSGGFFLPPYMKSRLNTVLTNGTAVSPGWWSPLTSNGNGFVRHTGSPLGQMVVPCYPEIGNNQISPCLFGQIEDVMIATDGYAHLGTTIPGWITYRSLLYWDVPVALRSPGTFTPV